MAPFGKSKVVCNNRVCDGRDDGERAVYPMFTNLNSGNILLNNGKRNTKNWRI